MQWFNLDGDGVDKINICNGDINALIYERGETPFGKTWEEWTALWWQWVLSIPKDGNPGSDQTGKKLGDDQKATNVIFLVGTFGGSAERNYNIAGGKAVLFPIINFTACFTDEPNLKTNEDLKSRAKHDIDDIVEKKAIINGSKLEDFEKYRVRSDVFDVTYPSNNVFGVTPGPTLAVSDGYWVFLKPLPQGQHDIHVAGSCSSGKTKVQVTWHLTVRK